MDRDPARTIDGDEPGARAAGVEQSARIVSAVAGLFLVGTGTWAFVHPGSFFAALAAFEPFNEHFVRDIGAFQVGLGAVLLLAVVVRDALTVALAGVGFGALVHTIGHVIDADLGGRPWLDIPSLGVMAVVLLVVAALRWRATSPRRG